MKLKVVFFPKSLEVTINLYIFVDGGLLSTNLNENRRKGYNIHFITNMKICCFLFD